MKSLFLLLFLITSMSASAQVWIDQQATWHYDYWNVASVGFYDIEYVQDTIVGGKSTQQIEATRYQFGNDQSGTLVLISTLSFDPQFTYVSSDTVFYWNDDQFFTLFNFGASIGDQWQIGSTAPQFSTCHDSSFVEVTDTGLITINAVNYRTITLATVDSSSIGLQGTFVERYGFMDSSTTFQPFPRMMNCDETVVYEWDYLTFKCFEDDSFSLYNPSGEDCEYYLTHLGIEDPSPPTFELFPNPTSGIVTISTNQSGTIQVIDCLGRLVHSAPILNLEKIDLSSFENGTYTFVFQDETGTKARQHLVKMD